MADYVVSIHISDPENELTQERIRNLLHEVEAQVPSYELTIEDALERVGRTRQVARKMFGGLMPGETGNRMADEVALKVLAAADNKDWTDEGPPQ